MIADFVSSIRFLLGATALDLRDEFDVSAASIAEAEFHGEIFFSVFKAGKIAVLTNDGSMAMEQRQMSCGDDDDGDDHVRRAVCDPRLGGDGKHGGQGKDCVVLEHGEGQVRLIARWFAGEGDCGDFEKENVGEEKTESASNYDLGDGGGPGEQLPRRDGAKSDASG